MQFLLRITFLQQPSTTTLESMCPKSYLYIYDFSAYLHMCPSQLVGTDRNRFWDQPVLCIFHPEGHVSQQDLQCWINPFSMFSLIYSRRTSSSMGERLYIGPHEGSFPGCKSIGQSYGRCSSSILAFTLSNTSENYVYFFGIWTPNSCELHVGVAKTANRNMSSFLPSSRNWCIQVVEILWDPISLVGISVLRSLRWFFFSNQ